MTIVLMIACYNQHTSFESYVVHLAMLAANHDHQDISVSLRREAAVVQLP